MNTKAILATLAVLGSSTAAMADSHAGRITVATSSAHTVSVQRPVARPIISRPVATTVSVQRPVTRPVTRPIVTRPIVQPVVSVSRPIGSRDRDHDRDRDRGHGPVVQVHPVLGRPIIDRPIYQPVYTQPVYTQPVYTQPVYTQPVVDNCNASGMYVGPIGSVDSYDQDMRSLTEPTQLLGGRETINLGAQVGPIDDLVLEANNDATSIQTVQVNFLDGSTQRFDVRETLGVGNPELTLELGHRDVASLIVYGQSSPGATYQVLAT